MDLTVAAEAAAAALQPRAWLLTFRGRPGDIADDAHLRARGAIVEVSEPDGRTRAAVGAPLKLSKGGDIGLTRGTPRLGEHEDYVFGDLLGLSAEERRSLERDGAIY
ncbi:MAG: CoA transferase [Gammaproteobacteria bacterium]|nr:CoA transferase [Gammaproteobacteria bacterium]